MSFRSGIPVLCIIVAGLGLLASVGCDGGPYDSVPLASHVHESYAPYGETGGGHGHHGHHGSHSAGSYYHYHVPVVSQGHQHYEPSHYMSDHSHHIWAILLLLAIPLIGLKLLPFLLIPLLLSLLALLGGGGMMMMMMMM